MRSISAPVGASRLEDFEMSCRVGPYGFAVRTNMGSLAFLIRDLLMPWQVGGLEGVPTYHLRQVRHDPPRCSLHLDDRIVQDEGRAYPGGMIDFLMSDITKHVIDDTEDRLVVHASAASWGGRGVLMPAAPDAGKTTTVAGLTIAGLDYLTDEAALIEPGSGRLHPYARPLSVYPHTVGVIPGLADSLPGVYHEVMARQQYHIPAHRLRPYSLGMTCSISHVIVPSYEDGASVEIEPLGRADAVVTLIENCFNFERFGRTGFQALVTVVERAACYRVRIGDLTEGVMAIRRLIEQPSR